jgi:hypothetical protein
VAARHRVDEVLFELPKGWGLNGVLVAPGGARGFATNLVMTRGTLGPAETLEGYVDRQIAEMAKTTKKFLLRGRADVIVAGLPAVAVRCAWHGVEGPVEQEITMLVRSGAPILFTATVPKNQADKTLPILRAVLSVVSFDDAFVR